MEINIIGIIVKGLATNPIYAILSNLPIQSHTVTINTNKSKM